MSSTPAIRISNLSKSYRIQRDDTPRATNLGEAVTRKLKNPLKRTESEIFWALKDIDLEIERGEVVGIIGRNGAGKSTLLKVLSRITEPTTGRIELFGRVGSLLEVGTGFHPELTGRENIFLNGAILGMRRSEIKRQFDAIVDFAGVEKFLDTPVKRYSSGMYVRLAFAVAAHLNPEILIVDEVLAVGDAEFQKKCLGKMQDVAQSGRTVLFVSHNMGVISQLTEKSLVLSHGNRVFLGSTCEAVTFYASSAIGLATAEFDVESAPRKYRGTGEATFTKLAFQRSHPVFEFAEPLKFTATIRANAEIACGRISMTVFTANGAPIGSSFGASDLQLTRSKTTDVAVTLNLGLLAPGSYHCAVCIGTGDTHSASRDYDIVHDTLIFDVAPAASDVGGVATWSPGWGAVVFPRLDQVVELGNANQ